MARRHGGQFGVKLSTGVESCRTAIDRRQTIADCCVANQNKLPRSWTLGSFPRFEEEFGVL